MNFERRYEDTYEPVDVEINGTTYCERIHKRYVIDAVKKYFHVELTDTDFSSISDAIPYRDGYHYFEWSGGWLSEGFSSDILNAICIKRYAYQAGLV